MPRAAPQFTSGVSLVEVYATVTDAQGEPIPGLSAGDFVVEEDGAPQAVQTFAHGEFPLALAVSLDRSFSMSRARLAGAAAAVQGLFRDLHTDDQAMLVAIGSETEVLAPLSRDRGAALSALGSLEPWGTTPLYDAMLSAIRSIQSASGRRALVLVSDGDERYSMAAASDVIEQVRHHDVLVYPVALSRRPSPVFAEVAALSGGRSFHVTDVRGLPAALAAIARELRTQYLLGYTPPTRVDARPGWRSIRVRVNRPNARVRARDGYLHP